VSTTTPDMTNLEADAYLKEVTPFLAAVPAEERSELLDDLAEHLREIAAEPGPPLVERLGSPAAYAAELLASAGVTATATVGAPKRAWRTHATSLGTRLQTSAVGREITKLWPVLIPCWWILRAYLAVSLLAALTRHGHPGFPIPHLAGNAALGLIAVIVAIPVSVRLGQRQLPRIGRLATAAGGIVLAISALVFVGRLHDAQVNYVQTVDGQGIGGCLTNASGQNITNIYAYGPDGTLLDPVLLYDQDGQPIDNLCPNFDDLGRPLTNQYAHDVNGAPVINAFPRIQSVPADIFPNGLATGPAGQTPAAVPVHPPAVVIPKLAPTTTTTTTSPPTAAGAAGSTATTPAGATAPATATTSLPTG
jgi:uncharacterized membrane protein